MPIPADSKPLSVAAYALTRRNRGLVGGSHVAVQRAIKAKRLVQSVVIDALGHPKIADPELADREWAANTDYTDAPGSVIQAASLEHRETRHDPRQVTPAFVVPVESDATIRTLEPQPHGGGLLRVNLQPGSPLSEANAANAYWKAKNEELKYRTEAKELVEASTVAREWADITSTIKTKLMGIPTRAKQELPELTVVQLGTLSALLREVLEGLADER